MNITHEEKKLMNLTYNEIMIVKRITAKQIFKELEAIIISETVGLYEIQVKDFNELKKRWLK